MKDFVFIIAFTVLAMFMVVESIWIADTFTVFNTESGRAFKERDRRLFELNNRLTILEEQRDIEKRVTDLEKALRVFCLDGRKEMCGVLGPVK